MTTPRGSHRTLNFGVVFLVTIVALAVSSKSLTRAEATADVLEATAFDLVDDKGNTIASLASESGLPVLKFFDAKGQVVTVLSVANNGASLKMEAQDGTAAHVVLDGAKCGIRLIGPHGESEIGQTKDSSFWTLSADKVVRIKMDADQTGAHLRFNDGAGKERLVVGVDENGVPTIQNRDANGTVREIR